MELTKIQAKENNKTPVLLINPSALNNYCIRKNYNLLSFRQMDPEKTHSFNSKAILFAKQYFDKNNINYQLFEVKLRGKSKPIYRYIFLIQKDGQKALLDLNNIAYTKFKKITNSSCTQAIKSLISENSLFKFEPILEVSPSDFNDLLNSNFYSTTKVALSTFFSLKPYQVDSFVEHNKKEITKFAQLILDIGNMDKRIKDKKQTALQVSFSVILAEKYFGKKHINKNLLFSIIKKESRFNPSAYRGVGRGLMQLTQNSYISNFRHRYKHNGKLIDPSKHKYLQRLQKYVLKQGEFKVCPNLLEIKNRLITPRAFSSAIENPTLNVFFGTLTFLEKIERKYTLNTEDIKTNYLKLRNILINYNGSKYKYNYSNEIRDTFKYVEFVYSKK